MKKTAASKTEKPRYTLKTQTLLTASADFADSSTFAKITQEDDGWFRFECSALGASKPTNLQREDLEALSEIIAAVLK